MSRYLSFAVKHPLIDLTDKEKCFAYCDCLCKKFVDIYSKFGNVTYYIRIDSEIIQFTLRWDDEIIATVEVFPDFFFIDPFHDDWELLNTSYVSEDARWMMQVFDNEIKEIWYFNDECVMPTDPHCYSRFKEFIDDTTNAIGGHIPVLNTEKHTIDGVPYVPTEMRDYEWIAFYERFDS